MNNTYLSVQLAETLMKRFPHPDNYPYISWCYPQGFLIFGIIRLYEDTKDKKYYEYVMKYAEHHVGPEGNIYRFKGQSMDDMMAGSVLVWAYHKTGLMKYLLACNHIYDKFKNYPRNSKGGYLHTVSHTPGEMWVDGVFMGGMFLINYGAYIAKKEECFTEVIKQLDTVYECCHKKDGLLYHACSECRDTVWADKITDCSSDVWSEGLGWYALIMAETLRLLPDDHLDKSRIAERFNVLLNTLAGLQNKEQGLWYQVVDKPDEPDNWMDSSGSAMFVYAFAQAVLMDIGDAALNKAVAQKGIEGLCKKAVTNEKGLIDIYDACDGLCVQNNYRAYIDYPKRVNAKEAVAAVLWAFEKMEWHVK